ncbi:ATP-binding protein [uncultured Sphingomonas sp.]|uniref:ATP-binding protein n=1 Tax=uncultured Sphingomonas sp. TaxID=158754 RepID=UPI0035CC9A82
MTGRPPRRPWADLPLRTKGATLAALPLSFFIGALFWVAGTTKEEEAAVDRVQQALRIQDDLGKVEALVHRAALQRATGTDGPSRIAEAERFLPDVLANLDETIRDREQRGRLAAMTPIARQAVGTLRMGVADDYGAELAIGRLERAIAAMRRRESVLLADRKLWAERAQARNFAVTLAAGALGVVASLGAMLLFTTGIVRRIGILEANSNHLARGEPLAPPPFGSDEVGRLGSALVRASALLFERQRRLEELVARLFQVQEEERRRVAYDLHDGVAQVAAAAHGHLQAYAERFPPATIVAADALARGLDLVQLTVRETRAAIAGLRPTALDDFGLALAVRLELDALRDGRREVVFIDRLGTERLPPVIETALFRIAQEALTNIRKHAGPVASVMLLLESTGDAIRLEVADAGRGLSDGKGPAGIGERIGLDAMRERAALLGGRVRIEEREGGGTRVLVMIPNGAGLSLPGN